MDGFTREVEALINQHSLERDSNTPDFILAGFLRDCLHAWNEAVVAREQWYGRTAPSAGFVPPDTSEPPTDNVG